MKRTALAIVTYHNHYRYTRVASEAAQPSIVHSYTCREYFLHVASSKHVSYPAIPAIVHDQYVLCEPFPSVPCILLVPAACGCPISYLVGIITLKHLTLRPGFLVKLPRSFIKAPLTLSPIPWYFVSDRVPSTYSLFAAP